MSRSHKIRLKNTRTVRRFIELMKKGTNKTNEEQNEFRTIINQVKKEFGDKHRSTVPPAISIILDFVGDGDGSLLTPTTSILRR